MDIGIGLPSPVPGVAGSTLLAFARRAEERGFAALSTIDRIAYPSFDSLTTLAAAAGATSRVGLMTNIVLAPAYEPVVLARAVASLDQLSGGRFTLGLAPGGRADDYGLTGRDFAGRGRQLDELLALLPRVWRGDKLDDTADVGRIGPRPVRDGRVPMLIGGTSDRAFGRVVAHGDGWTAGGGGPDLAAPHFDRVRREWREAGRAGEPRLAGMAYFSLGDDAAPDSQAYLHDYYAFLGPYADMIANGALRTPDAIRGTLAAFRDLGCTEFFFTATTTGVDQVDRLADLVL